MRTGVLAAFSRSAQLQEPSLPHQVMYTAWALSYSPAQKSTSLQTDANVVGRYEVFTESPACRCFAARTSGSTERDRPDGRGRHDVLTVGGQKRISLQKSADPLHEGAAERIRTLRLNIP